MSEITIRKATIKDAEKLRELRLRLLKHYPDVYGTSYQAQVKHGLEETVKEIENYSRFGSAIFVAADKDKLVGMCRIEPTEDTEVAYAGRMGVLPEYLGKGVGKLLFDHRLTWAREYGYKKLTAIVRKKNTRAVAFLAKKGLKIISEGNYRGVPEWNLEMKIER